MIDAPPGQWIMAPTTPCDSESMLTRTIIMPSSAPELEAHRSEREDLARSVVSLEGEALRKEAHVFLRGFPKAKVSGEPARFRARPHQAGAWGGQPCCRAAQPLALLEGEGGLGSDGATPSTSDVMGAAGFPGRSGIFPTADSIPPFASPKKKNASGRSLPHLPPLAPA